MKSWKWLVSVGLIVCLLMAFALPMCAPAPPVVELESYEKYVAGLPEGCFPVPRECFEQAMAEGELKIYSWAEWLNPKLYVDFTKEFGIKVTEDPLISVDENVAKYALNPYLPYDLHYSGPKNHLRLKQLGIQQEINHDWIPNVDAYVVKPPKGVEYLKDYRYCIPILGFFTIYAINTAYVDENDPRIPSWEFLFESEEVAGRIAMLNDKDCCLGAALQYLGYSFNSVDEEELNEAGEVLLRQKPRVLAYDSGPRRLILEEEVWLFLNWNPPARAWQRQAQDMGIDIKVILPTEGTFQGFDTLDIPQGSLNPAAAHLFLNYLYRPEVYVEHVLYLTVTPTHTEVAEFLPAEWKGWPEIYPSEEYIARSDFISPEIFEPEAVELRAAIWEKLKL